MTMSSFEIWTIIVVMGIGTFLIRFSFIGLVGSRPMPEWLLRHLRYTAVAIIPGLVAPLVFWPDATGGQLDPPRLAAAGVTLAVGYAFKNVLYALLAGASTLYTLLFLLG